MKILILRFDAPLMSFGGTIIDNFGITQAYPSLSMICGMVANALGYHHRDFDKTQRLQERIRYASRCDRRGTRVQDYQTVDLGAEFMLDKNAWTTAGVLEERKGGSASTGTHIRYRDYWSDAVHTIALTLTPAQESPTIEQVAQALKEPERPLFIGRKPCLPAAPIFVDQLQAEDLLQALEQTPLHPRADKEKSFPAWWPATPGKADPNEPIQYMPVTDARDWKNQIHVGERWIAHGKIQIQPPEKS